MTVVASGAGPTMGGSPLPMVKLAYRDLLRDHLSQITALLGIVLAIVLAVPFRRIATPGVVPIGTNGFVDPRYCVAMRSTPSCPRRMLSAWRNWRWASSPGASRAAAERWRCLRARMRATTNRHPGTSLRAASPGCPRPTPWPSMRPTLRNSASCNGATALRSTTCSRRHRSSPTAFAHCLTRWQPSAWPAG